MSDTLGSVAGVVVALVVTWLVLVGLMWWAARREGEGLRDALRLLPDLVVLVRRLAADRTLPRAVRWRLAALLGYLLLPVDLVPDVVPVVGWADDVVVAVWVLRSVVRRAGPDVVERHWPGTPGGLAVVRRLCAWT
ncbi:DUF1232 domain-containing protein [Nocardioides marmoraquaticus]